MTRQKTISIKDGKVRHPDYRFNNPINLDIYADEQIAIVGPNGGGKSLLVDVLTGRHPLFITQPQYDFYPSEKTHVYENIKYMTFRDSYGETDSTYYYQQRWNQHDIDNIPTVKELLDDARMKADNENLLPPQGIIDRIYEIFHIDILLDKPVILLSSGELRKFQLTKTLLSGPRILIMDNPFIGLDSNTRDQLKLLLEHLAGIGSLQLILVLSKTDDMPSFITHTIEVSGRTVYEKVPATQYIKEHEDLPPAGIDGKIADAIMSYPYDEDKEKCVIDSEGNPIDILSFNNVSIRYGERTILESLDWKVRTGECWSLSGENGSGKSTLLSLVCADNPQAYACDIFLFGRKRGTGESIWDIKRHIGYVSPEMHRAYLRDLPAIDIVASGLHDSVGLYVRPKPEHIGTCEFWMDVFGIKDIKDKTFLKLSSGEQRLVLLARAFVKDPQLLILDEPLHGLDMANRAKVKQIIETFSKRRNKTIIMVTHYKEELPPCMTRHIFLERH